VAEELGAHAEEELVGNLVAEVDARREIENGDGAGEVESLESEVFKETERHIDIGEALRPVEGRRHGRLLEEVLIL
jgi:hypothetical protein